MGSGDAVDLTTGSPVDNTDYTDSENKPASTDQDFADSHYGTPFRRFGYDYSGNRNDSNPDIEYFVVSTVGMRDPISDNVGSAQDERLRLSTYCAEWLTTYASSSTADFVEIWFDTVPFPATDLENTDGFQVYTDANDVLDPILASRKGVMFGGVDRHHPYISSLTDGGTHSSGKVFVNGLAQINPSPFTNTSSDDSVTSAEVVFESDNEMYAEIEYESGKRTVRFLELKSDFVLVEAVQNSTDNYFSEILENEMPQELPTNYTITNTRSSNTSFAGYKTYGPASTQCVGPVSSTEFSGRGGTSGGLFNLFFTGLALASGQFEFSLDMDGDSSRPQDTIEKIIINSSLGSVELLQEESAYDASTNDRQAWAWNVTIPDDDEEFTVEVYGNGNQSILTSTSGSKVGYVNGTSATEDLSPHQQLGDYLITDLYTESGNLVLEVDGDAGAKYFGTLNVSGIGIIDTETATYSNGVWTQAGSFVMSDATNYAFTTTESEAVPYLTSEYDNLQTDALSDASGYDLLANVGSADSSLSSVNNLPDGVTVDSDLVTVGTTTDSDSYELVEVVAVNEYGTSKFYFTWQVGDGGTLNSGSLEGGEVSLLSLSQSVTKPITV